MLHEVLLALSGHPSPLFEDADSGHAWNDFRLLSTSEKALLESLGRLSSLHRKLNQHIDAIARQHESIICRAVATSIKQKHLSRFQDRILDVESRILKQDANIVGAYDIVPLSAVVNEFEGWHRRMTWYWDMACLMQAPPSSGGTAGSCSGAVLIDRLRIEQQSGFPDIEDIAIELSRTAETAWLRQIATWVIHGQLASIGAPDFFIQTSTAEDTTESFQKDKAKLPKFVSPTTASSIVFIGKSLHQVREYGTGINSDLTTANLRHIASLSLPIVPTQLSRAITAIRTSVSQDVLRHLLPQEKTLKLLSCLRAYFLLGSNEFAIGLINEAQHRLQTRRETAGLQQDPMKALQGLSIKDAELQQVLFSTWKALASLDFQDHGLDFARGHVQLSTAKKSTSRPSTSDSVHGASIDVSDISFNDLLFPSATLLSLKIMSPLDLFMSTREVELYSLINSYLLAIKRAQLRLSNLWRRTAARRDYPTPDTAHEKTSVTEMAAATRIFKRRVATRKIWATCSAAIFLISETLAYFEGGIITESWNHFIDWVQTSIGSEQGEGTQMIASTSSTGNLVQRDPETLASGHRAFLAAVTYGLLLNDVLFTKELRSLLGNVDTLVAFFIRLLETQQKLDMDVNEESAYLTEEESRYSLELDRARKKVDSDLKSVVHRLRKLDQERLGSARYFNGNDDVDFEPWKSGGVDRLLMKLEFGRVEEGGFQLL